MCSEKWKYRIFVLYNYIVCFLYYIFSFHRLPFRHRKMTWTVTEISSFSQSPHAPQESNLSLCWRKVVESLNLSNFPTTSTTVLENHRLPLDQAICMMLYHCWTTVIGAMAPTKWSLKWQGTLCFSAVRASGNDIMCSNHLLPLHCHFHRSMKGCVTNILCHIVS